MSLASAPFHAGCQSCGTHFPVEIPQGLVDAAGTRQLVIFAGAGISTEAPGLFPETFYEEVEARIRDEPSGDAFPKVMQDFVDVHGRRELIRTMLDRIDYVSTFRSLQNRTTAFHHEIATIAQLDAIFTTNWDDFFERFAGARPFVLDEDFAFFDMPGRRVMKVHGSISNLSTIVATTQDYVEREADLAKSVMGAKLRDFLSTRTIVFVGYSLSDSDFQSVYKSVIERMGAFRSNAYIVTPVESSAAADYGLVHLRTDGGHFAHLLKSSLEETGQHIPDRNLDRAGFLKDIVLGAHTNSEFLLRREDLFGAFTYAYQDGLLAALGRIDLLRSSGEYSDPAAIRRIVHSYSHAMVRAVELQRYFDASYIEGYLIGSMSLLLTDDECMRIPIQQTFSSPTYRAKRPDPHADADRAWWIEKPTSSIEEYLRAGDKLSGLPVGWMEEQAVASQSRAIRTRGLAAENRQLRAGLAEGMVPQHSEFLTGID